MTELTYKGKPVKAIMYAEDQVIYEEKITLYLKMNTDVFLKSNLYKQYKPLFNCDKPPNIPINANEKFYVILSNKDM